MAEFLSMIEAKSSSLNFSQIKKFFRWAYVKITISLRTLRKDSISLALTTTAKVINKESIVKKLIFVLGILTSISSFAATVTAEVTAKYGSGVVRRDTVSISNANLGGVLLLKKGESLGSKDIDSIYREYQQYPGTSRLTRHIVGMIARNGGFGSGLPQTIVIEEIHVQLFDNGTSRYNHYTFGKSQMPAYEKTYGFSQKLGEYADHYCLKNVSPCLNLGW